MCVLFLDAKMMFERDTTPMPRKRDDVYGTVYEKMEYKAVMLKKCFYRFGSGILAHSVCWMDSCQNDACSVAERSNDANGAESVGNICKL